jgi:hypothetical protein
MACAPSMRYALGMFREGGGSFDSPKNGESKEERAPASSERQRMTLPEIPEAVLESQESSALQGVHAEMRKIRPDFDDLQSVPVETLLAYFKDIAVTLPKESGSYVDGVRTYILSFEAAFSELSEQQKKQSLGIFLEKVDRAQIAKVMQTYGETIMLE